MRRFASLRTQRDIAALTRRGARLNASTLYGYGDARTHTSSVAVAVSKAVGGAVVRNLIRRRVRGALETGRSLARPVRLLVIARPAAARAPYSALAGDVAALLAQLDRKLA